MPFPHQGRDGLLTCGKLPQQIGRGIETAWDKSLEFGNPGAIVPRKGEFETSGVSQNDHRSRYGLVML